jgi:hypothetical protein
MSYLGTFTCMQLPSVSTQPANQEWRSGHSLALVGRRRALRRALLGSKFVVACHSSSSWLTRRHGHVQKSLRPGPLSSAASPFQPLPIPFRRNEPSSIISINHQPSIITPSKKLLGTTGRVYHDLIARNFYGYPRRNSVVALPLPRRIYA